MKGLLVRVGIDTTKEYGGWNAPVDINSRRFVFVPIRDQRYAPPTGYIQGGERSYREVIPLLEILAKKCGCERLPTWQLPRRLHDEAMHLDPDFLQLTYGDGGNRGRKLEELEEDDFLAFYASLRPQTGKQLLYALVGILVLDGRPRKVNEIPQNEWINNAHTRWADLNLRPNDIVARGKPYCSGIFEQCIPIGGWRKKAYRVEEKLLLDWGGLGVNDGWIQRSANLPAFDCASKFREWLRKQDPTIVQRQF